MMNVAFCIICHKNTKILQETVRILSSSDLYIHVDKKSDINTFKNLDKNNVKFLKNRIDVKWGSYSLTNTMLNLLMEAQNKKYDYIFFISGDCLPLKNEDQIKSFLRRNKGKEFISKDINYKYKNIEERVKYRYPNSFFKSLEEITIKERIINRFFIEFKPLFRNKYFFKLPRLYKGSNWIGITGDFGKYIQSYLSKNPEYVEAFKKSYISDEVFFHTIFFNSPFRKKAYDLKEKSFEGLRYIDWETGPDFPRLLNNNDFQKIKIKSTDFDLLFARKFSEEIDLIKYRQLFIN